MSSRAKRGICRFLSIALTAGALSACEPPIEPFTDFDEPRVLVHAVLDPSADTQQVMIETTNGAGAVAPAMVRITTPTGVEIPLRLSFSNPNTSLAIFIFTAQDHTVQPGGTYHLRIERSGADPITGSTTVPTFIPGQPGIDLISGGLFRPDSDTLRLSWARTPGARGYEVVFTYELRFDTDVFFSQASVFAGDTSIALAGNARSMDGDDLFRAGRSVNLMVIAADDNYYTYYRVGVDPFAGAPPSRLTGGALGVFGSIARVLTDHFEIACSARTNVCPQ